MKNLLAVVLSFALLSVPGLALAGAGVGAELANGHKAAITTEDRAALNRSIVAFVYHKAKAMTAAEFEKKILPILSKQDRADLGPDWKKNFADPDAFPFRLEGDTFIGESDGRVVVTIRWPEAPKPVFIVNGITWTYNPKQPMKWQLALLERKLAMGSRGKTSSSFILDLLNPRAHANAAAVEAVIEAAPTVAKVAMKTRVGLVIGNFLKGFGTNALNVVIGIEVGRYFDDVVCGTVGTATMPCLEWQARVQKAKDTLRDRSTAITAVEEKRTDAAAAGPTVEWLGSEEQQCPSSADDNKNVYVANLLELKVSAGKVVPQNDWFSVRLTLQSDGKPKEGFVAPKGTDMNSPDAIDKAALYVFRFDDNGLKAIEFPNPKYDSEDPASTKMIAIDMLTPDDKLDPDTLAKRDKIKSMIKSLNDWIAICMRKEQVSKYLQQQRAQPTSSPGPAPAIKTAPTGPVTAPSLVPKAGTTAN